MKAAQILHGGRQTAAMMVGLLAFQPLAVPLAEQGAIAGVITSANGISFVLAPALGITLYMIERNLPFAVCALLLVGLALFVQARLAD